VAYTAEERAAIDGLGAAIAEHRRVFSGTPGLLLVDWAVVAYMTGVDEAGDEVDNYALVTAERSALHSTIGLLEHARHYLAYRGTD
jgi:hypothetical protein